MVAVCACCLLWVSVMSKVIDFIHMSAGIAQYFGRAWVS